MKSFSELRRGVSRSWDKYQLQQTISRGILLMEGHKQAESAVRSQSVQDHLRRHQHGNATLLQRV